MPNAQSNQDTRLEIIKLAIEAARVLAWPAIVLLALYCFRSPISKILVNAVSISVGSFKLDVEKNAASLGGVDLAKQIGSLSVNAVRELIATPPSGPRQLVIEDKYTSPRRVGLPSMNRFNALIELDAKGLISFSVNIDKFNSEIAKLTKTQDGVQDPKYAWYNISEGTINSRDGVIFQQSYKLTDEGIIAYNAIVSSVAYQLSGKQ